MPTTDPNPADQKYSYTPATPANMAAYEKHHAGRSAMALDTCTGELSSASSGDYFMLAADEALVSAEDEETPLALVVMEAPSYRDALTGKIIAGEETIDVESIEWRIYDADTGNVIAEDDREGEIREMFRGFADHPGTFELHSRKVSAWEVEA